MASWKELVARCIEYFSFSKEELQGILPAIAITAVIFSFRDWGADQFNISQGLIHLLIVGIIAAITFFFRISCQKIYALKEGYKADFKVWWAGLIIALILAFVSKGIIPLVLIGSISAAFMVRQRLGEFRYGFSHFDNANIGMWGMWGNLILAILFSVGLYYNPDSYFFSKGVILNLIMAFCTLLPFPQLDGLNIFFGSRNLYVFSIFIALLGSALLLSKTTWGLITAIVISTVIALFYILIGSEK
ncbi:hypothetical protein HYX14_04725 [Candidatus Woesearchaeota archaeon]|nr:hypothetical protein [Candidatus Woesearchaeota archaeon]